MDRETLIRLIEKRGYEKEDDEKWCSEFCAEIEGPQFKMRANKIHIKPNSSIVQFWLDKRYVGFIKLNQIEEVSGNGFAYIIMKGTTPIIFSEEEVIEEIERFFKGDQNE